MPEGARQRSQLAALPPSAAVSEATTAEAAGARPAGDAADTLASPARPQPDAGAQSGPDAMDVDGPGDAATPAQNGPAADVGAARAEAGDAGPAAGKASAASAVVSADDPASAGPADAGGSGAMDAAGGGDCNTGAGSEPLRRSQSDSALDAASGAARPAPDQAQHPMGERRPSGAWEITADTLQAVQNGSAAHPQPPTPAGETAAAADAAGMGDEGEGVQNGKDVGVVSPGKRKAAEQTDAGADEGGGAGKEPTEEPAASRPVRASKRTKTTK